MRFDPRQVVAAFLTFSMFFMLANMIKRDHFDYDIPQFEVQQHITNHAVSSNKNPWMEKVEAPKPCWKAPSPMQNQSKGYITFSLTIGPAHHLSQIINAAAVARYLQATLVVPDIIGNRIDQKIDFNIMYDTDNFISSFDGVIEIVKDLPAEVAASEAVVVRVPNRVSDEYIKKSIEPLLKTKKYIKLAIFFPSVDLLRKEKRNDDLDSVSCIAMFKSLKLNPSVQQTADAMVEKLRSARGKFVAVDIRAGALETNTCKAGKGNGRKRCYNAKEVADFLRAVGFGKETTVYVTQTWWHDGLNVIKESFPGTYTKDDVMPAEKKGEYLKSNEMARVLDLYVCEEGDAFVPAIEGLFEGNVVGRRIGSGRTQVMVPGERRSLFGGAGDVSGFVSGYVREKKHWVYGCYC